MTKYILTLSFILVFSMLTSAQEFLTEDIDYSVTLKSKDSIQLIEIKINKSGVNQVVLYKGFPEVEILDTLDVKDMVAISSHLGTGFYTVSLKSENGITVGMKSIEIKE